MKCCLYPAFELKDTVRKPQLGLNISIVVHMPSVLKNPSTELVTQCTRYFSHLDVQAVLFRGIKVIFEAKLNMNRNCVVPEGH